MILLRLATTERLVRPASAAENREPIIWRSSSYNSMAITLDTPDGTLVIANAYLPPNVDSIPKVREAAVSQHAELQGTPGSSHLCNRWL